MKKLFLSILVISSLLSGNVFSFGLPKDVGSGNSYTKSLGSGFKKHGVKIVKEKDGFPVRAGKKSVRFEVRFGDCGKDKPPGKWNDCKEDRQRHELSGRDFKGKKWVAFSIYLPEDFKNVDPVKLAMGQFHQRKGSPTLMFQFNRYGYYADRQLFNTTQQMVKLLDVEDMIGKWNDILIHGNFTKKESGFYKVWVNNELKYKYSGATTSGKPSFFKFGIYQTHVSRYRVSESRTYPTQIVFFDEIRHGKNREKVVGNLY
ncbi:heparin lyase I family protein [Pelagibacterales bacterium SAG-MED48]|nr:heparin lyase I family protein [Pelagibacterales bacterium SAG-MED48]